MAFFRYINVFRLKKREYLFRSARTVYTSLKILAKTITFCENVFFYFRISSDVIIV